MRKHYKVVLLVTMLLMYFALALPASPILAEQTIFHNITVDTAYEMITKGSFPNLVVLDVRSKYEYDMGHLYGAVLIPYDELETRISELEENDEIIVYCRSGYRSAIASQILADHNFTKVYNMLGGVLLCRSLAIMCGLYRSSSCFLLDVLLFLPSLLIRQWNSFVGLD